MTASASPAFGKSRFSASERRYRRRIVSLIGLGEALAGAWRPVNRGARAVRALGGGDVPSPTRPAIKYARESSRRGGVLECNETSKKTYAQNMLKRKQVAWRRREASQAKRAPTLVCR